MNLAIKFENVDLEYKRRRKLSIKNAFSFSKNKQSVIINKYKALNNISFSLDIGKILGIIGNNGAGKSTLLRVISGNIKPDAGITTINASRVSLLALGVGFNKDLTGLENIYLNGMLLGFTKKQIAKQIDHIIAFSELGNFIYQPIKTYSSGMVSRLGFSIAINLKPEILLIDETLSVGDIKFRDKSFKALKSIIDDTETTVVLVSHNLEQIKSLCDEVLWLDKGYTVKFGPTEEVLEAYINKAKEDCINNGSIVKIDDFTIGIDLSNYEFNIVGEEKKNNGQVIDVIAELSYKNAVIKVTRRMLDNGDFFIYFEVFNPETLNLVIDIDKIINVISVDDLYSSPSYDHKYGNNIVSGPKSYIDMQKGSMMISKMYYYDEVALKYDKDHSARAYNLISENDDITIEDDKIKLTISDKASIASFFVMVSSNKIFRQVENIRGYFKGYFESLKDNGVWNSYFILPQATMTKLPREIEPNIEDGYGFNIYHSLRTEMIPFINKLDGRYFHNMILNSILQMILYQDNDNGFYYVSYTPLWIKDEFKLITPYIDIRANDNLNTFMQIVRQTFNINIDDNIRVQNDNLLKLIDDKVYLYKSSKGIFIPDYMSFNGKNKTYGSLTNNISIANNLYFLYLQTNNYIYLQYYKKIMAFISDNKNLFIKNNGDLHKGIKEENGKIGSYGEDSTDTTLISLLKLQMFLIEVEGIEDVTLTYLINNKINYLKKKGIDLLNVKDVLIDSHKQVSMLYKKLVSYNKKF